jgi:hypothetical protein
MRALSISLSAVVCVGILSSASPSFAQKGDKKAGDGGKAPKVKVYDFSGDTIEGELLRPEGENIGAIGETDFGSLIRIRREFIAEIIKAAENL